MADQLYWEDVAVGTEVPELTIHITTQKMVMWAAAGESYPQIHYDPYFAREEAKNPDVIVHGFQKHAYLGRMLYEWVKPAGQVLEYGCQFRGMDFPNQDMICHGVVTRNTRKTASTTLTSIFGPRPDRLWKTAGRRTPSAPGPAPARDVSLCRAGARHDLPATDLRARSRSAGYPQPSSIPQRPQPRPVRRDRRGLCRSGRRRLRQGHRPFRQRANFLRRTRPGFAARAGRPGAAPGFHGSAGAVRARPSDVARPHGTL